MEIGSVRNSSHRPRHKFATESKRQFPPKKVINRRLKRGEKNGLKISSSSYLLRKRRGSLGLTAGTEASSGRILGGSFTDASAARLASCCCHFGTFVIGWYVYSQWKSSEKSTSIWRTSQPHIRIRCENIYTLLALLMKLCAWKKQVHLLF